MLPALLLSSALLLCDAPHRPQTVQSVLPADSTTTQADSTTTQTDSISSSVRNDTLPEVEVRADSMLRVMRILKGRTTDLTPHTLSAGDVLEKWLPGINDMITHPFAIKQRKRERKHKRDRKLLDDYDKIITIQQQLDAIIQHEGIQRRKP